MGSWLLLWVAFLFIFLLPPIGYGWGYRRWGPPFPRYVQRRRAQRAAAADGSASFDHHSWGWGGDFVWLMLCIWMIWAIAALSWR
jgi:hypothetical protein